MYQLQQDATKCNGRLYEFLLKRLKFASDKITSMWTSDEIVMFLKIIYGTKMNVVHVLRFSVPQCQYICDGPILDNKYVI